MRFCSINIYSGEHKDENRKKELTKKLRNDSNLVVDAYLKSLKLDCQPKIVQKLFSRV